MKRGEAKKVAVKKVDFGGQKRRRGRQSSGRPGHYGAALAKQVPVRMTPEKMAPIREYCEANGLHASTLLREAALGAMAAGKGPRLGLGVAHWHGKGSELIGLPALPTERYALPVGFTQQQYDALVAYTGKRGWPLSTFVRDAALRFVGGVS